MAVDSWIGVRNNPRFTWLFEPLPFPQKPRPKEKRITIIVGIRCPDGIVMAADSRLSGGVMKRKDYQKLHEIPIGSSDVAIVGGAGTKDMTERAVESLERKLKRGVRTPRQLKDQCESVYSGIWKHYVVKQIEDIGLERSQFAQREFVENVRQMHELLNFYLLVGARLGSEFHLFKVVPTPWGTAGNVAHYDAIGSGEDIALYVLGKTQLHPLIAWLEDVQAARRRALNAVDEAKKVVEGCGGPTHVWTITKDGPVSIMSEQEMVDIHRTWALLERAGRLGRLGALKRMSEKPDP
jgi:20S proteasome alpha/beta subunit